MIQQVPELTILTEFLPGTEPMGRALMFHYPSNTVAEILPAETGIIHYDGPIRKFKSKNPEGEPIDLVIFIHRTATKDIEPVFDIIEDGHRKFADWVDSGDDALDDWITNN